MNTTDHSEPRMMNIKYQPSIPLTNQPVPRL
jgi:hypothetical protein